MFDQTDLVIPPQTRDDWRRIEVALAAPFEPWEVDFRVEGRETGGANGVAKARVVAYIDRGVVIRRLNQVVGAENWTFEPEAVVQLNGAVVVCKGYLTICGVTKADFGDAPLGDKAPEKNKTAASDSLKRAATAWGIGTYLYELRVPMQQVSGNSLSPQTEQMLRAALAQNRLWKCPQAAALYGVTVAPATQAVTQPGAPAADTSQGQHGQQAPQTSARPARAAAPAAPAAPAGRVTPPTQPAQPAGQGATAPVATEQQMISIRKLCEALHRQPPAGPLAYSVASDMIKRLSADYQRNQRDRRAS